MSASQYVWQFCNAIGDVFVSLIQTLWL